MIYFINCPEIMIPTSCLGWWCLLWFMYHLQGLTPKRPDDSGEANRFYETKRGGWATPVTGVEFESTSKWRAPGWGRGLYYTHVGIINQRIPPKKTSRIQWNGRFFFVAAAGKQGSAIFFLSHKWFQWGWVFFFQDFRTWWVSVAILGRWHQWVYLSNQLPRRSWLWFGYI